MEGHEIEMKSAKYQEHLKRPFKPVYVSFVNLPLQIQHSSDEIESVSDAVENIQHSASEARAYKEGYDLISNKGEFSVDSRINEVNKFSEGYYNCFGIAVVGYDDVLQKDVSYLAHINPESLRYDGLVLDHVREKLKLLSEQVVAGSVDAVVFGGRSMKFWPADNKFYTTSVGKVVENVEKIFGFSPVIIKPKSEDVTETKVYLDTVNRRIYLAQHVTETDDLDTVLEFKDLSQELQSAFDRKMQEAFPNYGFKD